MTIPPQYVPISDGPDDQGSPLVSQPWYLALNEMAKLTTSSDSLAVTINGVPVTY